MNLLSIIDEKKKQLDSFRPLPSALVKNLAEAFKIEFTYTSNALEGNTLTRNETMLVVEKGITVAGKTLQEHLEAINHAYAIDFIEELARTSKDKISLADILAIHRLILKGIHDEHAGVYRKIMVRIAHSPVKFPDAIKVPELMEQFIMWLHTVAEHPVKVAAEAHLKLVMIHPFVDGNGRTSRLLMNLLLMQYGYPPAIIRKEDRLSYINALEKAYMTGNAADFETFIYQAVIRSLDMYIEAAQQTIP